MTKPPVYVDVTVIDSPIGGIASRSGLILSDESREWLAANRSPMPMLSAPSDWPVRIDPRNWMRVENQANQGSCQGHSLSSVCEGAYYLATGGVIQFSRQFAYIASQKIDNINGDSGSTVSGGVRVAMQAGLCREELWPYTGNYTRNPPSGSGWDACNKDAENYLITGQTPIENYDEALAFIASGKGWVHTGFSWGSKIDNQAAQDAIIREWVGTNGGGHSVCFVGYNPEGISWASDSEPLLINANSWSPKWGDRGFSYWTKAAFNAMCAHKWSEVTGLHTLKLGADAVLPEIPN